MALSMSRTPRMDTADQASAAGTAYEGDLVVQTGRLAGARRPLKLPFTVIGKAPGADIRLNGTGVADYHCVLLAGPHGLVLRDLGSEAGTMLNGDRAVAAPVADGDLLAIGAFRFRISLTG